MLCHGTGAERSTRRSDRTQLGVDLASSRSVRSSRLLKVASELSELVYRPKARIHAVFSRALKVQEKELEQQTRQAL